MTTDSDSNRNLQLSFSHPSLILPTFLSPIRQSTSYSQEPRKKRSKVAKNEAEPASTSSQKPVIRPKHSKKPDPGAPKITRPCTECGKKFWSWKALFGHMRCHPEREWRGINPPPNHRHVSAVKQLDDSWVSVMSDDDHEVAACLLMLVNDGGPSGAAEVDCNAGYRPQEVQENEFTGPHSGISCRFECGGCKKVFGSHQALGGHRASHKNVKGCFAITKSGDASEVEDLLGVVDQNKVGMLTGQHKCSICMRVFSSGRALGGHMRCHCEKMDEPMSQVGPSSRNAAKMCCGLDLNLPARDEDSSSPPDFFGFTLDLRLGL